MARIPCPDCGGFGRKAYTIPGVPPELCVRSSPCETCWPKNDDGTRKFWADGTEGTIEVEDRMDSYNITQTDFLRDFSGSNFETLVKELAEQHRLMTITRDGKPVAVIIAPEDYEKLVEAYLVQELKKEFPGAKEVDGS